MTLTAHRTALLNRPESVQLHDLHISVPEELEAHVEIWNRDFLQSMRDLVADAPDPDVYFYHSDHLGSASWITDGDGIPVQHLQYLPYGEPYINQRVSGYSDRFTFTGKERDKETGFGYFGARYMDHELMTMWLSVDPLADKYPNISPYAYCAWNPVKLVDPDGRDVYIIGDEKSKEEALRQIQQKSKNMKFFINEHGKLSFDGEAKTRKEKYMAEIIQSGNVHVNLEVQNHSDFYGETIDIGGFDGNVLSGDGKSITTFQVINVARSSKQDLECENMGNMIWHEISESYEGGRISLVRQENAPSAIDGNDEAIYRKAHYAAGKFFPGTIKDRGTIKQYIESLPLEVQKFYPQVYMMLNGDRTRSWYSRQ